MKLFKKCLPILLVCIMIAPIAQAQNDTNKTAGTVKTDTSGKGNAQTTPEKKTDDKKPDAAKVDAKQSAVTCSDCVENIKTIGWVLIFSPVILLFLAFYYFLNRMKKDKYSLASALSAGTETRKQVVTNKDGAKEEMEYTENIGSASRTIAFFTGITAIIIASCLTTFQGYNIVAGCSNAVDFTGLWKILGALGIGVIPYGINVWNRNAKEQ